MYYDYRGSPKHRCPAQWLVWAEEDSREYNTEYWAADPKQAALAWAKDHNYVDAGEMVLAVQRKYTGIELKTITYWAVEGKVAVEYSARQVHDDVS
jgi:hypothetical protein